MRINVADPYTQTLLFSIPLFLAILLTIKKESDPYEMNITHTNQLKGLAILMVIFSHIGYFLDAGQSFLYPLSVAGGVGVNIFLFLSGFGLTLSELKSGYSIREFYAKRLKRIYFPMWVTVIAVLLIDYLYLKTTWPPNTIFNTFLGFFPRADIFDSLNSPLWYFSFILFYYLIFPLLFIKKYPIISVFLVLGAGILAVKSPLPIAADVLKLYKLHTLAFPIGMFFAVLEKSRFSISAVIKKANQPLKITLSLILLFSLTYTAIYSGVGTTIKHEELTSLVTMISFVFVILFLPYRSKLLSILGIFSYELYLIQWPILYRYDFLYKYLPAWISTILYLILFILIAMGMKKIENLVFRSSKK